MIRICRAGLTHAKILSYEDVWLHPLKHISQGERKWDSLRTHQKLITQISGFLL